MKHLEDLPKKKRAIAVEVMSNTLDRASNPRVVHQVIVFREKSKTGQSSKGYHVKIADRFHKEMDVILYFPQHPSTPVLYVTRKSNYQKTQLQISEYLRQSNGEVSPECVKVVLWHDGKIYHLTNLDKSLELRSSTHILFDNRNKFNKVVKDCAILLETDGKCRLKLAVALMPAGEPANSSHVKNGLAVLTPSQLAHMFRPAHLRVVADADSRKIRRVYPKMTTEKNASRLASVEVQQEEMTMVSQSDELFGSDSGESSDDTDRLFGVNESLTEWNSDTEAGGRYAEKRQHGGGAGGHGAFDIHYDDGDHLQADESANSEQGRYVGLREFHEQVAIDSLAVSRAGLPIGKGKEEDDESAPVSSESDHGETEEEGEESADN